MDSSRAHRMSAVAHIYDQALPRWHNWAGPLQGECDGSLRNQQRGEARLRSSLGPVECLLHLHAVPRFP